MIEKKMTSVWVKVLEESGIFNLVLALTGKSSFALSHFFVESWVLFPHRRIKNSYMSRSPIMLIDIFKTVFQIASTL